MLFHNPDEPIASCKSSECGGCKVKNKIHCHFKLKDCIHFVLIALPGFLVGGAGINYVSKPWLALWLVMIPCFFAGLEIRVLCSHCPHYAESGRTLKCWANYGAPKIWKYRPGPMTFAEKLTLLSGFATIFGYPLVFLIIGSQWFLLTVYFLAISGFFMTLKLFLCTQCMNFACPLNAVDNETRNEFFQCNPEFAKAWHVKADVENVISIKSLHADKE